VQVGGSGISLARGTLALAIAFAAALVLSPVSRAEFDPATRVAPGVHVAEVTSGEERSVREGERPQTLAPRIVGGRPIAITRAPWQAALTLNPALYEGNAFERAFCGGSVVSARLILSAAHCMIDPRTETLWADGELAAITGRTQLTSNEGQEIPVSRIFIFVDSQGRPLFTGASSAWDVSIVELAQPSTATPIKIPGPDETELWADGRRVHVTGWGATSFEGPGSDVLRSAEMAVLPDRTCLRPLPLQFDTVTSLCAGVYTGKRDSCQGDSGGPLTTPTADGSARLVGNVQSGFECARRFLPAFYGRFGADPLRSSLREAVAGLGGGDIVGSGAKPPPTLTRKQAIELSFIRADDLCERLEGCRVRFHPERCRSRRDCPSINARRCRPKGTGYRCKLELFAKTRRDGKFRCVQSLLWTADSGTIEREDLNKRSCRDGW
jgi:Trypsin